MPRVYLALGSNVGDRRAQFRRAVEGLAERGVAVRRASSLYDSAPMYRLNQARFLNAVVEAETELTPEELLAAAKDIERLLGRRRRVRNGPREIDIDVLLYEGQERSTALLAIPHPRMTERPFVLTPLAEVRDEPALEADGLVRVEGPEWAVFSSSPQPATA